MIIMKPFGDCSTVERVERWQNVIRVLTALSPHVKRYHWSMAGYGRRRKRGECSPFAVHWMMGVYGHKTKCGTIACAAGYCGLDRWFRRQGHRMDFRKDGIGIITDVAAFFGNVGYRTIFLNTTARPVSQVIKEVRKHIKMLQQWDC